MLASGLVRIETVAIAGISLEGKLAGRGGVPGDNKVGLQLQRGTRETRFGSPRMSKSDFRTPPEPKKTRRREGTYRWDVGHGLMLLLSPSRSSAVVVSVNVPTSDSVRVRV